MVAHNLYWNSDVVGLNSSKFVGTRNAAQSLLGSAKMKCEENIHIFLNTHQLLKALLRFQDEISLTGGECDNPLKRVNLPYIIYMHSYANSLVIEIK